MSDTHTVVHLLRHGEVHNPSGVLYGRLPGFRLSEDGVLMAKKAAEFLTGRDVTAMVASPLERAVATAEPLAAVFGLDIQVDERLVEAENQFEGLTVGVGQGALRNPRHWQHLRNPFRPSWGEPYQMVAARMLAAADAARDAARGHEAVCVSHQLPIWVTRRKVEGRRLWHRPDRRRCELASITSLHYVNDVIVRVTYAEPAAGLARKYGVAGA